MGVPAANGHGDSKRAFLSAITLAKRARSTVETQGKGAFYLDGASKPYNWRRKAREGSNVLSHPCDLNASDIEGNPSSDVLIAQCLLHAGGWSVKRMLIGVRPEFLF